MIGQEKLLKTFNSFTLDTFPKSSLILGEYGSGKHTLLTNLSEHLKLDLIDITSNISFEYINDIYSRPIPAIYFIDTSLITEKQQNVILKFLEEPLKNSYVVLLSENKTNLLDTIINRCFIFELEQYARKELEYFIKDDKNKDLILNVCRTPGQILSLNLSNIQDLYQLCDKIVNKLNQASYANTLTIADKINYKDDYNKFDINIFFETLIFTMFNSYLTYNNKNILPLYYLTVEYRKKLRDKRLNKAHFMENYLTNLWLKARGR